MRLGIKITISFVATIFLLEGTLLLLSKTINETKIYRFSTSLNIESESEINNAYNEISPGMQETEIVFLGDSYTNSGRLSQFENFPYFVWESLEKRYTVRNMGMCELSTNLALRRLEDFLESSEYKNEKRYLFVVLIGAANYLSNNKSFEGKITQPWRDITVAPKWFERLRSYKFFRTIYSIANNRLLLYGSWPTGNESVERGIKNSESCLREESKLMKIDCLKKINLTDIEALRVYENYRSKVKNNYLDNYETIELFVRAYPKLINLSRNLVYDFAVSGVNQEKYTLQGVINTLREFGGFLGQEESPSYYKDVLENLIYWDANTSSFSDYQRENLSKMIQKTRALVNAEFIIMTYPLRFKFINDVVRETGATNKITVIDLENHFSKHLLTREGYERYIDDWQHTTVLGNKEIAQVVKDSLIKFNKLNP